MVRNRKFRQGNGMWALIGVFVALCRQSRAEGDQEEEEPRRQNGRE